jgi:pimeloyl-ACP methyl ester carboxylesterase
MPNCAEVYYHAYNEEEGHKIPLVLIHGAGGTHLYWPSEIRRLPGYRIFALDLPGHGKSGGCGLQSIPAYTRAVLDWLEGIGLNSAVFVGHSMGSAIALSLALEAPEHVLALGLVGAGAKLQVAAAIMESASSATTYHNAIELIIGGCFSEDAPEALTSNAARRMAETRQTVLHGDFLACADFDLSERVSEISKPTLVVCGEVDRMTPVRYSQFLAAAISGAQLVVIPGAGHMVMLEQPGQVAEAFSRFLHTLAY